MSARPLRRLRVVASDPAATCGRLLAGAASIPCALGAGGRRAPKREGDGATPCGVWALREARYRADRMLRPACGLPLAPLRPGEGWCDAPHDPAYNRPVPFPYRASAESLWRNDGLYDILVVLGANDAPVRPARGSAIFLHIAREGYAPTEGCIAVAREHLLRLLPRLTRNTVIVVP